MKLFLKKLFRLVLTPLFWVLNSCSPIGDAVDKEKSLNYYYSKNNDDILFSSGGNWFALGKTPLNAHVTSFEVMGPDLARDKNHVYYRYSRVDTSPIDLNTLYNKNLPYYDDLLFDANGVYHITWRGAKNETATPIKIGSADPKTFERRDYNWAMDHKNWYYRNQVIPVAYDDFEILSDHYSKDSTQVYYHYGSNFKPLNADASSFNLLEQSYYGKDKDSLYLLYYNPYEDFKDTKIIAIDIKQNEPIFLSQEYLQVGDTIYYNGKKLPILAAQAEVVGDFYIKDDTKVFYGDQEIPEADAKSFTINDEGQIKDKDGFFRAGERFEPQN
jgi:hypothetical protein